MVGSTGGVAPIRAPPWRQTRRAGAAAAPAGPDSDSGLASGGCQWPLGWPRRAVTAQRQHCTITMMHCSAPAIGLAVAANLPLEPEALGSPEGAAQAPAGRRAGDSTGFLKLKLLLAWRATAGTPHLHHAVCWSNRCQHRNGGV